MRPARPLHVPVQLRRMRREHEQQDAPRPAGLLERPLELRAPVHLYRPDWEGHAIYDGLHEPRGARGGRLRSHLQDIAAGDDVPRREMLEDHAGQRADVERVARLVLVGCEPWRPCLTVIPA